ncbi:uncharacterized protein [Cardiocondyla obscurior]|uniref:uncharacterized protein n=1 Tax=Cardiocondyla obscurior TaxID=286306 RepID=UPI0039656D46
MRLILTLFLLPVSLSLSSARTQKHTNVALDSTVESIDQSSDYTQLHKSSSDEKYNMKQLEIRNRIGLNGKVHFDEENEPGIRAYGLPKKHLKDNGIIERLHLVEDRIGDTSKSGRLVEAYGIPKKNKVETNGFIERLPLSCINCQPAKLGFENEGVRIRRFVRTGSEHFENEVEKKVATEAEDMEAQDAKVFRPLFVYRQQVAARERRKHAKNVGHRNHRHATHQPYYHRRVIY